MADLTSNSLCNVCCVHYNAGLRCCSLGSNVEGGYLIMKDGGVAIIVAPCSTCVTRCWYCRNGAITCAEGVAACGDWFIPDIQELCMYRSCCAYWDHHDNCEMLSDTRTSNGNARSMRYCLVENSTVTTRFTCCRVRAFRKVYY